MSFGLGFAFPAYPLRGGGGNNPFNQSGPTLDLTFAGVPTDLSDPNGYSLSTDFIVPQYQIAAQYSIWENDVGLVSKTFSQIITFSRASGATWFNSVGVLQGVDFSVTSNTIGTGSKTFTLDATAGVNRYWTTGDTVLISDQANSANNMVGTVTSYNASTQVLVCNITSTGGSGTITSWRIGSTMPRFDYDPATLAARGFLIEEARTNGIRNNTMQGAVAGTPGAAPTNWSIPTPSGGLSSEVIGTGTENGVTYIDVRYSGTATGTAIVLSFDTSTQIAALNGQNWAGSLWIKNITSAFDNYNLRISLRDSGGAALASIDTLIVPTTTLARFSGSGTLANASVAFVQPQFRLGISVGVAYDVTIRIGLPQLELGAFATSVIPTTTTALTRSADVASVNTLSPWFNAAEGTLFAEYVAGNSAQNNAATAFSDGTNNNRMLIRATNASAQTVFIGVSSGSTQWTGIITTALLNTLTKSAFGYKVDDVAWVRNGGTVGTDTPPAIIPTVTRLKLGADGDGLLLLNGYLRRITYYPRRLSNAELQAITA